MDNNTAETELIEMAKSVGLSDITYKGVLFSKTFGTFSRWSYVQDNSIPVLSIHPDHFVINQVMLGYENSPYPSNIKVNWVSPVMSRPYDSFADRNELESVAIPAIESVLRKIASLEQKLETDSIADSRNTLEQMIGNG